MYENQFKRKNNITYEISKFHIVRSWFDENLLERYDEEDRWQ